MSRPDATDLQTVLPLICLAVTLRNEPADLGEKMMVESNWDIISR